jgi:hypothetical protein
LKQYDFFEGNIDASFTYGFTLSMFNMREHLLLQEKQRWYSFFTCERATRTINALIHFHIIDGLASSPLRAPYGGLEYSDDLPNEALFEFISFVNERLKALEVKKVIIKSSPEIYQRHTSPLATFLINHGYVISSSEVSAALTVSTDPLDEKLHRSEKRKLEKCKTAGLSFRKLPIDQLEKVYNFIKGCRGKKNFELSMSFENLAQTVSSFKDNFFLFGVYDENKLAAASIAIKAKEDILYEFYHDHDDAYDQLSPVVLLVSGIYDFCRSNKFRLLDLGTSSLGNKPNFPLLHFKLLLGATMSNKFTFEKTLS